MRRPFANTRLRRLTIPDGGGRCQEGRRGHKKTERRSRGPSLRSSGRFSSKSARTGGMEVSKAGRVFVGAASTGILTRGWGRGGKRGGHAPCPLFPSRRRRVPVTRRWRGGGVHPVPGRRRRARIRTVTQPERRMGPSQSGVFGDRRGAHRGAVALSRRKPYGVRSDRVMPLDITYIPHETGFVKSAACFFPVFFQFANDLTFSCNSGILRRTSRKLMSTW